MRLSTKAQMQMGEMVIVMIIFFMILALGLVFFTQFIAGEAVKEKATVDDLNLAETAKMIASLPELHCSQGGDEALYCIDFYKAKAFRDTVLGDPLHYSNTFAGYRIDVNCIYPACTTISTFTLMDYTTGAEQSIRPFVLPVLLYNPTSREHAYGELIIWQHT